MLLDVKAVKVKACRYLGANVVPSVSIWGTRLHKETPKEAGGV